MFYIVPIKFTHTHTHYIYIVQLPKTGTQGFGRFSEGPVFTGPCEFR